MCLTLCISRRYNYVSYRGGQVGPGAYPAVPPLDNKDPHPGLLGVSSPPLTFSLLGASLHRPPWSPQFPRPPGSQCSGSGVVSLLIGQPSRSLLRRQRSLRSPCLYESAGVAHAFLGTPLCSRELGAQNPCGACQPLSSSKLTSSARSLLFERRAG